MLDIHQLHQQFCDERLDFKENSPKTIYWYKAAFRRLLAFKTIQTVSELNKPLVKAWIHWGKEEHNWSPKTRREYLKAISLFLDWCVSEEYTECNPIKKMDRPKLPKRIPKHLPLDKAYELLDWTIHLKYPYQFEKKRAIAIIAAFMFTGVRKEELRSIKMDDMDLGNRLLTVIEGKGKKDRKIPLTDKFIPILNDYLKDRKRMKKECPYFFTAMRQDSQMGDKVIYRLVEKLRSKSGIYFTPHMLRHTFAVLMLESECGLYELSEMMGHADISTTTIYLTATIDHLRREITKHPLNDYPRFNQ